MSHSRSWFPIWIIPCIVLLAIGTVWLRLSVVRTTYEISQMDRTIRELQLQKEQAELKYAALKSPRRLELLARSRFSLSQPRADQIIHMGGHASGSSEKSIPAPQIRTKVKHGR